MLAADLADDARYGIGMAAAVERGAGIVDVDAFERGGEAVGVALAPHFAVGDDVEPGALLGADGDERRVVLGLLEPFGRDAPELAHPDARRKAAGEILAVDQPVGLGVGADERRRQQLLRHASSLCFAAILPRPGGAFQPGRFAGGSAVRLGEPDGVHAAIRVFGHVTQDLKPELRSRRPVFVWRPGSRERGPLRTACQWPRPRADQR